MEEKKSESAVSPYETLQEHGTFYANGYRFDIEPVYFEEEPDYFVDNPLSMLLQQKKEEIDDKDLSQYIIALFQTKSQDEVQTALGKFWKIKLWLVKRFKKSYKYYSDNPNAVGFIKWLEKKVKHKGHHIRFYDLERKYKLTKVDIARMYRYMEELSRGF